MNTSVCPGLEQLRSFVRCDVTDEQSDAISAHLQQCADCEQTVEKLERESNSIVARFRRTAAQPSHTDEPECQALINTLANEATLPPTHASNAGTIAESVLGGSATPTDHLRDYRLLEKLGEGGMGTVFKAQHVRLKRTVAVKILPSNRLTDPMSVARFAREMEVLGQLNHPHIVQALDAGEHDGQHYLVMEYVEGQDLAEVVKSHSPLRIADACQAILEAALGLQYAHENGYVHRDIKPSNLMVARTSSSSGVTAHVKILDLGLARALEHAPAMPGGSVELTTANQVMGTLDYMAPEQGDDAHQVDIRADIYSLGATLYKLLTGTSPFAEHAVKPPLQRLMAIAVSEPPAIQTKRPDVPTQLAAIVHRMLAKRPDDRFATPADVVNALAPFCVGANLAAFVGGDAVANRPNPAAGATVLSTSAKTSIVPATAVERDRNGAGRLVGRRALGWGAAAVVALAVILTVTTRHGTVTVESPTGKLPDDVEVVVSQNGQEVAVLQAGNQWSAKVVHGEFQAQLRGGDVQLEIANSNLRVSRLGRAIVEVKVKKPVDAEPVRKDEATPVAAGKSERPFVLRRDGQEVRRFVSFGGALADQKPGDWIEVHSNQTLEMKFNLPLPDQLSVRGGPGFRPLLRVLPPENQTSVSPGSLWKFERCDLDLRKASFSAIHREKSDQESVCHFVACGVWGGLIHGLSRVEAYDSIFVGFGIVDTGHATKSHAIFDHCAIQQRGAFFHAHQGTHSLKLDHCTYNDTDGWAPTLLVVDEGAQLTVEASHNVFHRDSQNPNLVDVNSVSRISWKGEGNCFSGSFCSVGNKEADGSWKVLDEGLSAWNKQWKKDESQALVVPKLVFEPGRVQRLGEGRSAAIGDHAARILRLSGDKIGPNWSYVGAGDAYLRALKAAGVTIADDDLRREQRAGGAFTLLGTVPRGFATLAAALQGAPDGAVVEVRGDGPFASEVIEGKGRQITVKAAPGFRPVLESITFTDGARVILEGLVLKSVLQSYEPPVTNDKSKAEKPPSARLIRASNCEVLSGNLGGANLYLSAQPAATLENCSLGQLMLHLDANSRSKIRNSVIASIGLTSVGDPKSPATVHLDHCVSYMPEPPLNWMVGNFRTFTPTRIVSSHSLYVSPCHLVIGESPVELKPFFWSGDENGFVKDSSFISRALPFDLVDWRSQSGADMKSRELRPWQLDPSQWKVHGIEENGQVTERAISQGVDVERMSAAWK